MKKLYIDVREEYEYQAGHVDDALNIPMSTISQNIPEVLRDVSRDTKIVVYCASGARASAVAEYLKSLGFTDVENGINTNNIIEKRL